MTKAVKILLFDSRWNPDQSGFWNFDLTDLGLKDLEAIFNHVDKTVKEETGQSEYPLFTICHSIGCAQIIIYISENDLG